MRFQLRSATAVSLLLAVAACGSDTSGPKIGPPARVEISTSPTTSGTVKGSIGTFAVKVSDANGQAVSGATVNFTASGGGGIVLTPTSATTDATGTARTTVVLGTLAGAATISASVSGVTTAASVAITTTPGAVSKLVATPDNIRLNAIGDTARITALAQDDFANTVAGTATYAIADPTLISVSTSGLVTALRVGGTTSVIATISGRADTVIVAVLAAGTSACTGVSAPVNLAVGATATVNGSAICIGGGAATSEYTVVATNTAYAGDVVLGATLLANGAATPPTNSLAPSGAGPLAVRSPSGGAFSVALKSDQAFHERILSMTRALSGRFSNARSTRDARLSASRSAPGGAFSPSMSRAAIPATVAVNDLVSLNTNGTQGCTTPQMRFFRVAAIGSKSIVLADTANPKNGFSDTDYARFAARFDTLVYPLDVGNFGAPSDIDNNGKVAVLFTKEVNALTPANAGSYIGGFFFGRDLFPKKDATDPRFDCPGSNEGEMFYMLVPDPTGTINGNRHSLGFVDSLTTSVIAHEFQHLINAGRRLYVNTTAEDFEDTWMNEGLSHVAEELLYYRESGMQPRQNLDDNAIRVQSRTTYPLWKADASSNFGRLIDYLENPGGTSPMDTDDELATRGSAWSLLRYSVDRLFPTDAGVWFRFVNSTGTGVATLTTGLQTDPRPIITDWTLANYMDDLGISTDPRFQHKSWNFRDIYTKTFIGFGSYPLASTAVPDNLSINIQVKGSSASYYRLAVAAGKEALLTFASGGGAPNSSFKFTVVRTK